MDQTYNESMTARSSTVERPPLKWSVVGASPTEQGA